jgi:hypothetical protein
MKKGVRYGLLLGLAYIVNVQSLTWLGLGLTGWVFAGEATLSIGALVALLWTEHREDPPPRWVLSTGALATMILVAGLVQQAYMVIYITLIHPEWVESVVGIRRELLTASGVEPEQLQQRLAILRSNFTPLRMLTTGVIIPGLWKLGMLAVVAAPLRFMAAVRPRS